MPDGRIDFNMKMCVAVPPTPVALPAAPGQMMIKAMFPVVDKTMVCHMHTEKVVDESEPAGNMTQ